MNARNFFYRSSLMAVSFSLLLVSTFAGKANANGINAQTLNNSVSDHYVITEDAYFSDWPKYHPFYIGVDYNYVNDPLTAISAATNANVYTIINSIQTFNFLLAYKATSHLGLYASIPVNIVNFNNAPGFPTGSSTAIGDLKFEAKIALSDADDNIRWALAPEIHVPTGSTDAFVSDASVYAALRLIAETWISKTVEIAANVGYGYASDSTISAQTNLIGIDNRSRILFGLGSLFKINDHWGVNAEFSANEILPTSQSQNPSDLYAGLRWMPVDSLILTAGAAVGKLTQSGGQNYRGLAGLRYSPGSAATPTPYPTPAPTPEPVAVAPTPAPKAQPAQVTVIRITEQRIELLSPILFENNSAKILSQSKFILDEVADAIKKHPKWYSKMNVDGHTNHIGTRVHNQKLSEARAKSVKTYLVAKGIPASHLMARGFGEDKPIYKITDPRAIEGNRRVEFNVPNGPKIMKPNH